MATTILPDKSSDPSTLLVTAGIVHLRVQISWETEHDDPAESGYRISRPTYREMQTRIDLACQETCSSFLDVYNRRRVSKHGILSEPTMHS